MVIILELDDDPLDRHRHERPSFAESLDHDDVAKWGVELNTIHQQRLKTRNEREGGTPINERISAQEEGEEGRDDPNINGLTQALTCYPFV